MVTFGEADSEVFIFPDIHFSDFCDPISQYFVLDQLSSGSLLVFPYVRNYF